jgi:CDGSH-type Zn-finger protein
MSNEPNIAGKQPVAVELEAGKQYAWCSCGQSSNQPYCDGSHASTSFTPLVFTAAKSEQAHLCLCKRTGKAPFCDGTHATLDADD